MADKKAVPLVGVKPVPMKLFATWEVDRTPPNCIPRLCSLTLTRLVLLKSLGADLNSIVIAVKMQGSKRTLRSNEMTLPLNGLLDTELQLSFSLQYPHFLKRDGNRLHVMLQRRKRYKNRAILGYKILAEGVINMSQVLQHHMEMELDLVSDCKEAKGHNVVVAKISVCSLSSQPVDHEENNKSAGRGVPDYSDEDEDFSSGNDEVEVEGSDSEPVIDERRRGRKNKMNGNVRQRNLKQKFISLLKRFRVNEDLQSLDNDQETISRKLSAVGGDMDAVDIEDLFEELEDLSDSGPEIDTMSISSTPKPSLRPFFSSSRSLLHDGLNTPGRLLHKKNCHNLTKATMNNKSAERTLERVSDESSKRADSDSHQETWTDSDPPPPNTSPSKNHVEEKKEEKERNKSRLFNRDRNNSSAGKVKKLYNSSSEVSTMRSTDLLSPNRSQDIVDVRRSFTDQISKIFPSDDGLPDVLYLINTAEQFGNQLFNVLYDRQYKVMALCGSSDIRTGVAFLVNKMQKYCNSCPKPPPQIKLLLAGTDSYVHTVLRHWIEQLSSKPPDWISFIRFFVIPLGSGYLCKYLGSLDNVYNTLFVTDTWKEKFENMDFDEIIIRIQRYLQQANSFVQLPIAEAMLTYKDKSSTEESSQIFIPFIVDVRLGNVDNQLTNSSIDTVLDESQTISPGVTIPCTILNTSSPPSTAADKRLEKPGTPPSSPNINYHITSQYRDLCEPLELQLDYWLISSKVGEIKNDAGSSGKKSDSGKLTLKSAFRSLQVSKLSFSESPVAQFSINYSTKEKKQKIMRLGKKKEKEKENEPKSQVVDGISRLICSPRTQNIPLNVHIDGNEWTGVKFFQLSSQWQTHIRNFTISLFSGPPEQTTN
ncbi:phosphofurin acidic cluster sorting protein 2 isoform X2 [Planococcus citri]|uniref:phosphofurin acidic cluster sorting protein 2 isoform X2 n=1 Tax=Planococcus citri TaxID=170843 RepID=UPI0031FA380E